MGLESPFASLTLHGLSPLAPLGGKALALGAPPMKLDLYGEASDIM